MPEKIDSKNLLKGELKITDGSFNWVDPYYYELFEQKSMEEDTKDVMVLQDININIKPGEFVAVVGKVGSGKSSLILSLMNELVQHKGLVESNGRIAYIS